MIIYDNQQVVAEICKEHYDEFYSPNSFHRIKFININGKLQGGKTGCMIELARQISPDEVVALTTYADRGGKVTLYGSSDIDYSVTNKFLVEPKNFIGKKDPYGNLVTYKNHWHFKATNKVKQKKMRFLAIIRVSDNLNYHSIVSNNEDKFEINGWTIDANLDISTPGYINIINDDLGLHFQSNTPNEDGVSKLIEIVNGEKIIKTVSDSYPASIISASKRINE